MLPQDPTLGNIKLVKQVFDRLKRRTDHRQNCRRTLTVRPRTPRFYITKKIHKPRNPGRPVVSSINCYTTNISKYYHLEPVVKQIPSYIKDTNDFINKINDIVHIPVNSCLVRINVKSLYTNRPNSEGISAVKNAYDLQIKRCGMGIICAHAYINIFLASFESKL